MHFGLAVSILLHVGVLGWALVTIAATPPLKPVELEPVEVAVVSRDDIVRLKQGSRSARQLEAKAAPTTDQGKAKQGPPRPRPAAATPAPPPPPPPPPPTPEKVAKAEPPPKAREDPIAEKLAALAPEPQPGPGPEELKRLEEQKKAEEEQRRAEALKKAEEEKKRKQEIERKRLLALKKKQEEARRIAEAKRKAEQSKKSFDEQMAAAIEKSPELLDKDPRQAAAGGAPGALASKAKGPTAGAPEGREDVLTASQSAMLGLLIDRTYSDKWDISCGSQGVDQVQVKVAVRMKPDGYLDESAPPRVTNKMASPLFAAMADAALRAVVAAQPVDFPADLYKHGWDNFTINFNALKRCGRG